ncbi:MMPL family transporter [Natribaculum luteum]|uniref:MMPL family transporter n=1 Tax=Natribaculum luteum TaxID=1586232 RepID=A0ABD5NUA3_9EURY|nr:MMPL family transporter [Natribaculum luteum]
MSVPDRVADAITTHSKVVLAALLVTTVLVGSGVTALDDDSSLEQFESESPEAQASEYVNQNFTVEETENTTTVQLIVRGENVLTRESLLDSLEFQQAIRDDESIDATLANETPIVGVENVVATSVVRGEQAEELRQRGAELEQRRAQLNATADRLEASLNETRELEREYVALNASYERGEINASQYQTQSQELEGEFDRVFASATTDLDDDQAAKFREAMTNVRVVERQFVELERANESGQVSPEEYDRRLAELQEQLEGVYQQGTMGVLQSDFEQLEEDAAQLEADQRELETAGQPPLEEQIEALEDLDDEEFESVLEETLSEDGENDLALGLMSSSYELGSTSAEARMIFVTQSTDRGEFQGPGSVDEGIAETQLEIREMADDRDQEYVVFGAGVITDEIDRSMGDSLAIVGPLALLFVVVALLVAYRDLLDIVLGVAGIVAVLVWTFGFMGWAGIAFNQMFVAVPVLLIGLSIDYAIHVFMRHREQREAQRARGDVRGSMRVALAGVGVALVWVTATTVIGFLANLVSPIGPIREFGVVSAVGILAALVVFGALIPAAKVELDSFLESHGFDRRKRAFGTGGGRFSDVLTVGSVAARKAPLAVLLVTLLLTAGGVYGATQVDTSFNQEDFLAESPPEWTDRLPEPFQPGEYGAKEDLEYVNQNFQREDLQAQILVRGDVTDDQTLERIADAEADANDSDVAYVPPGGEADVQSPLSVMERVAAENESFNASYAAADTDGDGVPDRNVEELYDQLFEVDPGAGEVIYRTDDGEYEAVRLVVSIKSDAASGDTTEQMRAIAATIDDGDDGRWSAIATGDPVVNHIVEQDLLGTVFESLLITLVVVFGFLSLAYRATGNSATLGAVTLLPVAFSVSWILGSMYLMGMSFNVLTGMITSLTIGLGVAYSIHVSSRYTLELERQGNVWDAMNTTVTGTGGALLGSAATTVGGFGTLALAILPVLRQFGIITGLTIVYAFLASVLVLPTLLVLWTRYLGPDVSFETGTTRTPTPTASDGGSDERDPAGGGDE